MPSLADYLRANPNNSPIQPTVKSQPVDLGTIKPPIVNDLSKLPVNQVDASNFHTQTDALTQQIKDLQKKVTDMQKTQTPIDTTTPQAPPQPDQSIWQKLLGKAQDTQSQIIALEKPDPAKQAILNSEAAIAQAGLTPEKFQQLQDMNVQMTSIQGQINDLDQKHLQDLQNIDQQTGITQDEGAAQKNRIERQYQIDKASLTSKGNLLGLQSAALQGNWDMANKAASDYIANSTAATKQKIDDLNSGMTLYKDLISAMNTSELNTLKTYNTSLNQEFNRQDREAQNTILDAIRQQNANTASERLNLGQSIKFSNAQKLQLGSYGLSQDNVNKIEQFLQQGNSIDDVQGLTDLQKQGLQQVMGGTQAKTVASDTMASSLNQISGDPSKWTQEQWTQNLNSFVEQFPDNATLAKQQFIDRFPKPSAPKSFGADPLGYLAGGFKSLFGGLLP